MMWYLRYYLRRQKKNQIWLRKLLLFVVDPTTKISKSCGKSKNPGKSKEKCWNYDNTSHFHKDNKKPKKKKALDLSSKKSQEDGDAFIVALVAHAFDNVWLIDLGASFHMTSHRSWFSKYEVFDDGKLYLGDDSNPKDSWTRMSHYQIP